MIFPYIFRIIWDSCIVQKNIGKKCKLSKKGYNYQFWSAKKPHLQQIFTTNCRTWICNILDNIFQLPYYAKPHYAKTSCIISTVKWHQTKPQQVLFCLIWCVPLWKWGRFFFLAKNKNKLHSLGVGRKTPTSKKSDKKTQQ